jgi:hypothetical protein
MSESKLSAAIDRVVEIKLKAVDRWIDEVIDELEKFGNPEKLLGKPYEAWTPQDLQVLGQIYGDGNDTPLAKLIFKKHYEVVTDLEKQLGES